MKVRAVRPWIREAAADSVQGLDQVPVARNGIARRMCVPVETPSGIFAAD